MERVGALAPRELQARAASLMFLNRKVLNAVELLDMVPSTAGEVWAFEPSFRASYPLFFKCVGRAVKRNASAAGQLHGGRGALTSTSASASGGGEGGSESGVSGVAVTGSAGVASSLWSLSSSTPSTGMGVAFCWDGRACSLRARSARFSHLPGGTAAPQVSNTVAL